MNEWEARVGGPRGRYGSGTTRDSTGATLRLVLIRATVSSVYYEHKSTQLSTLGGYPHTLVSSKDMLMGNSPCKSQRSSSPLLATISMLNERHRRRNKEHPDTSLQMQVHEHNHIALPEQVTRDRSDGFNRFPALTPLSARM